VLRVKRVPGGNSQSAAKAPDLHEFLYSQDSNRDIQRHQKTNQLLAMNSQSLKSR
jgi:hypothetical protein